MKNQNKRTRALAPHHRVKQQQHNAHAHPLFSPLLLFNIRRNIRVSLIFTDNIFLISLFPFSIFRYDDVVIHYFWCHDWYSLAHWLIFAVGCMAAAIFVLFPFCYFCCQQTKIKLNQKARQDFIKSGLFSFISFGGKSG